LLSASGLNRTRYLAPCVIWIPASYTGCKPELFVGATSERSTLPACQPFNSSVQLSATGFDTHEHLAAIGDSSGDDVLVEEAQRTTLGQIAVAFVWRRAEADLFALSVEEARADDRRSVRVSDQRRDKPRTRQFSVGKLLMQSQRSDRRTGPAFRRS
jgi:hypothetical protein